jgi:translation initiation factor 2 subunit 1
MKSKTVASIMRHVASKVPSTSIDGSVEPPPVALDSEQTEAATKAEADEKNSKKLRRAARKQAAATGTFPEGEDAVAVAVEETGGPTGSVGEEERLEALYEQIAWPLGKKYGHTYDAFKLALAYATSPRNLSRQLTELGRVANQKPCFLPSLSPSQPLLYPSSPPRSPVA